MKLKVSLHGETRTITVLGFSDEVVVYHCEFPRSADGVASIVRNCWLSRKAFEERMGVAL